MLDNIVALIPPLTGLLKAILYLAGILLVIQSLRLASQKPGQGIAGPSVARILTCLAAGVSLLAFPATLRVLNATLFGEGEAAGPETIFAYGDLLLEPLDHPGLRGAVAAIVLVIQFIGLIAVARGILFLNRAAAPGGVPTFGPGITFITAGAMAANFPAFFGWLSSLFAT